MDYWYQRENTQRVHVSPLPNVMYGERSFTENGEVCYEYTAAYCDPDTKVFYHSEGGVALDEDGMSFYQTKEAAKLALEFLYAVSQPKYVQEFSY